MTAPHDQDPANDAPIAEPLRPAGAPTWTPDPIAPGTTTPDAPGTDAVAFSTRNTGPSKLRAGVVAGAAVALAVGAVATSLAASPGNAPTADTPTVTTRTQSGVAPGVASGGMRAGGWIAPAIAADPATGQSGLTFDHRGMGEHGFGDITVTAISGSNVSLKTADGWTRTIEVTDSVKITKGGQTIALADLAVGDQVFVDQTANADGTYTVNGLVVVVPSVEGTVSDVSSSGFKVTNRDGSVWTITVNGSTQVKFGAGTGSMSDVTNGTVVEVQGEKTGDNALTALTVEVAPDRAFGTVKSKTADTIVITKQDGTTVTVHVDSSTTYRVAGATTATLSDVTVGMEVGVSGRARSDGSIDADTVAAGDGHGMRGMGGSFMGGEHGFGPGGFGPRGFDDDGDSPSAAPSASPTTSG